MRWGWVAGGAAVLACASGCSNGSNGAAPTATSSAPVTATTVAGPALSKPEADALSAAVTSADPAARATALAADVAREPSAAGRSLLPEGSTLAIDASTFQVTRDGLAAVEASVSGSSPGRWRLILVNESGAWKLLATEPAASPP
ncbi:MAG: hypothetical protein M3450_08845 [Actinomycetota bacterium]|nr:hypothetical protein [Actinomycetota bacterium]